VKDFFTKPLQGSLFCKLQKIILNLPDDPVKLQSNKCNGSKMTNAASSQEYVETKRSCVNVVHGTHGKSSKQYHDAIRHHPHVCPYPCQTVVNGKV
jgi:hypothetical protein